MHAMNSHKSAAFFKACDKIRAAFEAKGAKIDSLSGFTLVAAAINLCRKRGTMRESDALNFLEYFASFLSDEDREVIGDFKLPHKQTMAAFTTN